MREIEVKLKIADKPQVIQALSDRGCVLSDPVQQDDYIFLPKSEPARSAFNRPVLRLRQTKGQVIFTLKRSIANELDCLEREVVVADFQSARELIEALDYTLWVEVHKHRQKGKVGDLTVCVDTVTDLGDFIELEKLTDDQVDYTQAETELLSAIAALGIQGERVQHGFDTLMAQRLGKGL